MADKTYIVEGRQFRTETDYKRALRDQETMRRLREQVQGGSLAQLKQLKDELNSGKHKFLTMLGQDFKDEINDRIKEAEESPKSRNGKKSRQDKVQRDKSPGSRSPDVPSGSHSAGALPGSSRSGGSAPGEPRQGSSKSGSSASVTSPSGGAPDIDEAYVQEILRQQEKRRKIILILCSIVAVVCMGYFGVYSYYIYRTDAAYAQMSAMKEKAGTGKSEQQQNIQPVIHYDDDNVEIPEVLEEYKNLLKKNQKLIGWLKIDDTKIDYPVMQTTDNEYYLDHNLNQEYDKNGTLFMDKDCDVIKPSTNFIIYGHHMKSGKMFGELDKYASEQYAEKHPYIDFDTIYEHGVYQVMYVFRSKVYSEQEITFKYYQFIDAVSEQEFNSNMEEMAAMSLYDTGVTAQYGDRLLTLSTCDYQEKNGRFVVVAKKVAAKEY